jgi:hypothetical protein
MTESQRGKASMPKDYSLEKTPANKQRRPQYARDDAWTRAFLLRAQVAYVATHWDEQPFLHPTLYWYDPGQQKIFFTLIVWGESALIVNVMPRYVWR